MELAKFVLKVLFLKDHPGVMELTFLALNLFYCGCASPNGLHIKVSDNSEMISIISELESCLLVYSAIFALCK